jgi:hypothetical protein
MQAKMYYLLSFLSFLTLIILGKPLVPHTKLTPTLTLGWTYSLVAYYHRRTLAPRLPARMQHYMPLSSFEDQANAGLTSAHFDIESMNMMAGDSRQGLDEAGAEEVKRIMTEEGVG